MDLIHHFLVLLGIICVLENASGVMFYLNPNMQKCLRDEMQAKQLVIGEYEVTDVPGQRVDYIVRDSKGHILSTKEQITRGKFTFSSENFETYEICFVSKVPPRKSEEKFGYWKMLVNSFLCRPTRSDPGGVSYNKERR